MGNKSERGVSSAMAHDSFGEESERVVRKGCSGEEGREEGGGEAGGR